MFGSQVLETAIGLSVMFFIIALGSSSIVETVSRLFKRRAVDLEKSLIAMLTNSKQVGSWKFWKRPVDRLEGDVKLNVEKFMETSVYDTALSAAGKALFSRRHKLPSYLSAKAFADAAIEIATTAGGIDLDQLSGNLGTRARALHTEFQGDLTAIRAGLETWFDETMERLQGAYRRWASMLLFVVGLVIAVGGNASTFHVAQNLWRDPAVRQAVVESADEVVRNYTTTTAPAGGDQGGEGGAATDPNSGEPTTTTTTTSTTAPDGSTPPATLPAMASVAETVETAKGLGLPIGWDGPTRAVFKDADWYNPFSWPWSEKSVGYMAGWLVTAFLVMLGAPFWFDLMSRLVSIRNAGAKPKTAEEDDSSAVTEMKASNDRGSPTTRVATTASPPPAPEPEVD